MHNECFYTDKNINPIKIALISDLHYYNGYNLKIFTTIIKQIKKNKPTYITVIGDILDSSNTYNFDKLHDFFQQLASIAPVLIVQGNHENKAGYIKNWYYEENHKLIQCLTQINNVHYLDDSTWTDNNITFYGFNLSYNHYEEELESYDSFVKEINNLKCELPNQTYNITLFHSPTNIYTFLKNNPTHNLYKSDLILSGHMHNGCLPFIISYPLNKIFKSSRGLIGPNYVLFPKYAQGRVYEKKEGYIYEGITKLSKSTKYFHALDILFRKKVEFITIKNNKLK